MAVASSPRSAAHVRVRSRLQRDVAATAVELGLVDLALLQAEQIQDWRQGEVSALAAQALTRAGDRTRARACLDVAIEASGRAEGWMRERLCTEIALGLALQGDIEAARRYAAMAPPELTGRVEAELVAGSTPEEFELQCDAFDRAIATGSLDVVRSGIDGWFAVWARAYGDAAKCERAERAILQAMPGLPIDLQVGGQIRLAEAFAADGHPDRCLEAIGRAQVMLAEQRYAPEIFSGLVRTVALAEARHGDRTKALRDVRKALQSYETSPTLLVDIDRADYLRPLAETLFELGERDEAMRVWSLALEVGAVNLNARPRAEDLCLTQLSMVRVGAEPTERIRAVMKSIREGLKAPW